MDTKIRFGEMNPFINALLLGLGSQYNMQRKRYDIVPVQGIDSDIRSRTYKLGYQWQPEGSRWIDLKADIWRVRTTSTRDSEISPSIASTCVPTSATASASAKACSAAAPWGACSSPQSDGSGRTRV